jgi:2-hydroxychromene-2-carboxylate isomerase
VHPGLDFAMLTVDTRYGGRPVKLPFYYDYACPWAYLGSCRVEPYFGDLGVEIDFLPVSLEILYEPPPDGSGRPKPGPRKQAYYRDDLRHWAEMLGAEFAERQPEKRPSSWLLLQAAEVAKRAGRFREFHYPAYRARWAEGRDISRPELVRELLEGAGLDGAEALAHAEAPECRAAIEAQSRAAVERGVFGVPTLFVGEEMFWGNDRFELVRHTLEKRRG